MLRALALGRCMQEQGFMLALVAGVGGFLGARLMEWPARSGSGRPFLLLQLACAILFSFSFMIQGYNENAAANFLRAAAVSAALYSSGVLWPLPPRNAHFFSRLLWLSFALTVLGTWLVPCFPKLHVAMLHIIFIGGFSFMVFLIASMVTLSHSGVAEKLSHPLWVFKWVLAGVFLALAIRISAQFFAQHYFKPLAVAASVWILTAAVWMGYCLPFVCRVPRAADREACGQRGS